jgi:peptide/nickel transport system permease protein
MIVIAVVVLMAILAPVIAPYNPLAQNISHRLQPPSSTHLLGTDQFGRDILSRLIWGSQVSLFVSVSVVFLALLIGMAAGAVSGYYGGWVDTVIMRITEIFLAFPGVLLAIGIMAALGVNVTNLILALTIVFWPSFARIVRGQALSLAQSEYVQASRVIGSSNLRIIREHILPNTLAPAIVVATLGIGFTLLSEAALDFLGLGVNPPAPSWGNMIADGRTFFITVPYLMLFPGLLISISVLAFNLIGDGLRDALDPRLRV